MPTKTICLNPNCSLIHFFNQRNIDNSRNITNATNPQEELIF